MKLSFKERKFLSDNMKWLMRKCPICNRYTLKDLCPICKVPTRSPHPHRFSPEDRYVEYRVKSKLSKYLQQN